MTEYKETDITDSLTEGKKDRQAKFTYKQKDQTNRHSDRTLHNSNKRYSHENTDYKYYSTSSRKEGRSMEETINTAENKTDTLTYGLTTRGLRYASQAIQFRIAKFQVALLVENFEREEMLPAAFRP